MKTGKAGFTRLTTATQAGMVLLLSLVFLTALTLLGLSASAEALLQNRLAANQQETERARQSALAALSWAEDWLLKEEGPAPGVCVPGCTGLKLHGQGSLASHPEIEDPAWWMDQGHEAGIDPVTGERMEMVATGSDQPPVWIIEVLHEIPPALDGTTELQVWYRILARGSGRSKTTVSVIESTVVRSWPSIIAGEPIASGPTDVCPGSESTVLCGRVSWRELR